MFLSKVIFHSWDHMKAFFGFSLNLNMLFVREDPATIAAHRMHKVGSHSDTRTYVTDSTIPTCTDAHIRVY